MAPRTEARLKASQTERMDGFKAAALEAVAIGLYESDARAYRLRPTSWMDQSQHTRKEWRKKALAMVEEARG